MDARPPGAAAVRVLRAASGGERAAGLRSGNRWLHNVRHHFLHHDLSLPNGTGCLSVRVRDHYVNLEFSFPSRNTLSSDEREYLLPHNRRDEFDRVIWLSTCMLTIG